MMERRQHQRVAIDGWASLKHPLLGAITGEVEDISAGGLAVRLDDDMNFFVMMELDARIHAQALDESMPVLSVQVVRVQQRRIGLKFQEDIRDCITPQLQNVLGLSQRASRDAEARFQ